ncbi:MAG: [FeFe] hydrogenase H-cluster maturation GTPase HydF [Ruminococcus sp.]|nr:[FeFe] hydrogenase H-cluster maturation GTPase HydF [Ruminococcus sp.]
MGLNSTPNANRIHIGFFGLRNAGKSSVVNAVTGQDLSIVSDTKGTTTDPVYKSMEILPLGPCTIIDTAGFDDIGEIGELRVKKTKQVLNKTDIALLIVDATIGLSSYDNTMIELFKAKDIPFLIVYNKSDLVPNFTTDMSNAICISALQNKGIFELKQKISTLVSAEDFTLKIVGDLLKPNDFVVLVIPIDSSAPKGRLILPQQQVIRDILEASAVSVVTKETELKQTLNSLGKSPVMVITDSQAFKRVSKETPRDIKLTSFSILMARYKGILDTTVKGVRAIETLKDNDTILISEGCTHHRQCEDIGTVKIPKWLQEYTKKNLNFEFTSGTGFPEDLSKYSLIIHCGGCMLNEREVKYRMKSAIDQSVPFTNYGIAIAYMNGILNRSIEIFPHLMETI